LFPISLWLLREPLHGSNGSSRSIDVDSRFHGTLSSLTNDGTKPHPVTCRSAWPAHNSASDGRHNPPLFLKNSYPNFCLSFRVSYLARGSRGPVLGCSTVAYCTGSESATPPTCAEAAGTHVRYHRLLLTRARSAHVPIATRRKAACSCALVRMCAACARVSICECVRACVRACVHVCAHWSMQLYPAHIIDGSVIPHTHFSARTHKDMTTNARVHAHTLRKRARAHKHARTHAYLGGLVVGGCYTTPSAARPTDSVYPRPCFHGLSPAIGGHGCSC
jgi:hypothetical protein